MQSAVDSQHHLIIAHEVTNVGSDRSQLATMAKQAKTVLDHDTLDVVADRGYYNGDEIRACEQAGIDAYLPKPKTSANKAKGLFDRAQARLDKKPDAMRTRRATVEHPFGTIKSWMGATHFQTKTLPRVSTEMSLHVLAYNMKRVINLLGTKAIMAAIRA